MNRFTGVHCRSPNASDRHCKPEACLYVPARDLPSRGTVHVWHPRASDAIGCCWANMNYLANLATAKAPALITAAGDRAAYRFLEFLTAQIRNPHTRRAYVQAVGAFCAWLEPHGVPSIAAIGSIHVAAYVEELGRRHSA